MNFMSKIRKVTGIHVILALCLLFIRGGTDSAFATSPAHKTSDAKPKIGLVLSGGGARGAAHIGVLKVLEEQGITIDMISGTSMGAVVGGLYASGYSAAEIEKIAQDIDWQTIFDDNTRREDRLFRQKRIKDDRLMKFKLGFKDGKIIFPKGLIKGQKLLLELKKHTYPVQHIEKFDHLPIPFRAVATDIERGTPVILDQGDLGLAIFSSMSIPALLPPVEVEGRLLVDGGVANNLPIDLVRKMGAEIIIVVDVSSPLLKKDDLDSVLSVTNQLIRLLGRTNSLRQLDDLKSSGLKHIIIRPDLTDIETGDFLKVSDAIPRGEAAARAVQDQLAAFGKERPLHLVTPNLDPVIEFIKVDNRTGLSDQVILRYLDIKPGFPLSPETLNERIARVYGFDVFERVTYEIIEENDETGLLVTATESSIGSNHIRFGLILSDNLKGDSSYSLLSSLTLTELTDLGAEARFDAEIGDEMLLSGEYYQPVNVFSNLFLSSKATIGAYNRTVFEGLQIDNRQRVSYVELNGFGGIQLGSWGEAKLGMVRRWLRVRERDEQLDFFGGEKFISTGWNAQFNADTLDRISFPRNGARVSLSYYGGRKILGGNNRFDLIHGRGRYVRSLGKHTFDFTVEAGGTYNQQGAIIAPFSLGGFQRLSGLSRDRLSGGFIGYGALRYHYRLTNDQINIIDLPIYLGASLETGNTWDRMGDISLSNMIFGGSVFVGVESPIGPIYFGLGVADNNSQSLYFSLGQSF
tara:strand:+ start:1298 stop:3541 length:2244 start_codon:yes stop_codon:yes gene_type:complete